jgi:hypothetical protein
MARIGKKRRRDEEQKQEFGRKDRHQRQDLTNCGAS